MDSGESQPSQDSVMTVTEEDRHEILYFAYGSNLSTRQMCHRCPSSTPVGLGYLPGWRWLINARGYANVVKMDEGETETETETGEGMGKMKAGQEGGVWGLLYLLPPADEELLDGYEHVPTGYEKRHLDVRWERDEAGREVAEGERAQRALVYVDFQRTEEGLPWEEYVGRMERGIEEMVRVWGMDEGYAEFMRESLNKGTRK